MFREHVLGKARISAPLLFLNSMKGDSCMDSVDSIRGDSCVDSIKGDSCSMV